MVPSEPLLPFDVVNRDQYGNTYLVTSFCDFGYVLDSSVRFNRYLSSVVLSETLVAARDPRLSPRRNFYVSSFGL